MVEEKWFRDGCVGRKCLRLKGLEFSCMAAGWGKGTESVPEQTENRRCFDGETTGSDVESTGTDEVASDVVDARRARCGRGWGVGGVVV